MACGCPVVASDLAALQEVGGSVCQYCAVGDVSAWTRTVTRLLREYAGPDAGQAQAQRQQALVQAARYSWTENVSQTVTVYRQVMAQGADTL